MSYSGFLIRNSFGYQGVCYYYIDLGDMPVSSLPDDFHLRAYLKSQSQVVMRRNMV